MERTISFTLNGKPASVKVDDERMLLWVLRSDLGLTGTKFGCGEALVRRLHRHRGPAGRPVLLYAGEGRCRQARDDHRGPRPDGLHAIQAAFVKHHAFQCGYCTPGMILNAYALLLKTPKPTADQIARHMEDNLCRCGAHVRIVEAIQDAAGAPQGGAL